MYVKIFCYLHVFGSLKSEMNKGYNVCACVSLHVHLLEKVCWQNAMKHLYPFLLIFPNTVIIYIIFTYSVCKCIIPGDLIKV